MLNLVTGGAGFIGSRLVNSLVRAGESVIIIDNLTTGHVRNLERAISSGHATFIYGDIATTSPVLAQLLNRATKERVSRIYHLASPSLPQGYQDMSWQSLEANAIGTLALIELALAHESTLLFASCAGVYGDTLFNSQPETFYGNVDPVGTRSPHEEGKRFGEAAVAAAMRYRGLHGRIVRLFDCYGPAMNARSGLVAEMLECALRDQVISLSDGFDRGVSLAYVDDVIEMLRILMEIPDPGIVPIDVGSDEACSIGEVAGMVARVAGVECRVAENSEPTALGKRDPRMPNLRIARSHGWSPSTPLRVGIKLAYDWLCSERVAFA